MGRAKKKTADIVTIRGDFLPGPKSPDVDLIQEAEWFLERAKSGEVVGVTSAYACFDGSVVTYCKTPEHRQRIYTMIGSLAALQAQLTERVK